VFHRIDDIADDNLRVAIKACGNISSLAKAAKVGRRTIYDFLAGGILHPSTQRKIETALRLARTSSLNGEDCL
jgi:DNA-binding phage protein